MKSFLCLLIFLFIFSCSSESNSSKPTSKSKSTNGSSSSTYAKKSFTHSGYRLGYGETAFGNIDKIGVQPGPYDSEYCAFLCEHMDGLGR